ncbi:MAG: chemotaxis protein CheA [Thermoguttaceae bacterium]
MTVDKALLCDDVFADLQDDWDGASRYLALFIDEADQTLNDLVDALLALEAGGGRGPIEQLFIAAHRLKGSAASIGLNRVAKLAHFMEDVLQALVDGNHPLSPEIADAMLACTDGLRQYVDAMKAGCPGGDSFSELAGRLVVARKTFNGQDLSLETTKTQENSTPDDAGPLSKSEWRRRVAESLLEGELGATLVGQVVFTPGCSHVGLKARLIYEKLSRLSEIRCFDPPADQIETREQLDAVRFGAVTERTPESLARVLRVAGVQDIEIERLDSEPLPSAVAVEGDAAELARPSMKMSSEPSAHEPVAIRHAETVRVDIERLDRLMNLAGQLAINKARASQIAEKLKRLTYVGTATKTLAGAMTLRADPEHGRGVSGCVHRDAELVAGQLEAMTQIRACVNELFEAVHQLDRVSDGIHQSVMDARMLPIGPLFARFHRVIRDMTRANDKDIRLVVNGDKTELDKRMIDELADPMIHMVRNAADHGIESPAEREAAGKPRQGTIVLDACHRGSNIVIRVSDDGRGLNADRIRAKAVEKGLIAASDAERMTRPQIHQLIWLPGLSTAERVTETSGRGVGMDIVLAKIEELSGTIEIESEPGRGTSLIIKLPLTLAILPSLLVEIGGDVFALPLESVVEIIRVRSDELSSVRGLATVSIRDRVVPVSTLGSMFDGVRRDGPIGETMILTVLAEGDRRLGLAVDRVLGKEDVVIKSIVENYRNVAGVAGASILGDGRVSLILDPPTLIEMASSGPCGSHERTRPREAVVGTPPAVRSVSIPVNHSPDCPAAIHF